MHVQLASWKGSVASIDVTQLVPCARKPRKVAFVVSVNLCSLAKASFQSSAHTGGQQKYHDRRGFPKP